MLNVATDMTGYTVEEVKTLGELRSAVLRGTDRLLLLLRDTYIERGNLQSWLAMLTGSENTHKVAWRQESDCCSSPQVAFLMSPRSADLVPWQQWILSRTMVLGNTHSSICLLLQSSKTIKHRKLIGEYTWLTCRSMSVRESI